LGTFTIEEFVTLIQQEVKKTLLEF
jgi:hypothetical protein